MALTRLAGNRFNGDTLSDRSLIPLTLHGSIFTNLSNRVKYILKNGVWYDSSVFYFTVGGGGGNQEEIAVSQKNIYNTGNFYAPLITIPLSNAEQGPPIIGGKFTNYLVNWHQQGTVVVEGSVGNSEQVYTLNNTFQNKTTYVGEQEISYTFTGAGVAATPFNRQSYTAFVIMDSLSGKPTGIYVDYWGTNGVWTNALSATGYDLFIGSTWRTGEFSFTNTPVTAVRFRLNTPDIIEQGALREIGLWNKDSIPTSYTHALLNNGNTFRSSNTFNGTTRFSGGLPISGRVLTCIDSLGTVGWQESSGVGQNYFNRANGLIFPLILNDRIAVSGLQISGGNPTAGYVLVATDNLGNTTWKGQTGLSYFNKINGVISSFILTDKLAATGIQISGGNPTEGYVLTATDSLGNSTWRGQTGLKEIINGTPASGKILTCFDGLGIQTWQYPSGVPLFFGRNNNIISPLTSTDKFAVTGGVSYIPNITIPFSEGEDDMPIIGGKICNALINYHQRGTVTITTNTGCSISNSSRLYSLDNTFNGFSTISISGQDARIVFEFSGQTLSVPAHAVWEPFVITRLKTAQPTGITVDLYGSLGQWERFIGASGGGLFNGTVWRGNPTVYLNYPITGVRFTLDFPHNGVTNYNSNLSEIGIWNRNYIPTSFTHPLLNKSNIFEAAQILKSTIQISGGSPANGYILTATDNLGNATWKGQTGLSYFNKINGIISPYILTDKLGITGVQISGGNPVDGYVLTATDSLGNAVWRGMTGLSGGSSSTSIYREFYTVTGNLLSGSTITIPNSRTYSTGTNKLQVYTDGMYQRINSSPTSFDFDYWEISTSAVRYSYALPSGSNLGFTIFN